MGANFGESNDTKMKRARNDPCPDAQGKIPDARSTSKFRTGKVTRNPFLNFLREMRKTSRGMTITEVAIKGGDIWRKMDFEAKQPYCALARQARRSRRRGGGRRRGRRRGRRSRSRSRGRSLSRSVGVRSRSRSKRSRSRRKSRRR